MRLVSIVGLPTVAAAVLVAMVMLESASPAMAVGQQSPRGYSHLRMSHAAPFPKTAPCAILLGPYVMASFEEEEKNSTPWKNIAEEIPRTSSEYALFLGF
jgi:hypothetical protein